MPEPCWPKGRMPRVDWRAWAVVAGDSDRSPRRRGGPFLMLEAYFKQIELEPSTRTPPPPPPPYRPNRSLIGYIEQGQRSS